MPSDREDNEREDQPRSHWLLWFIVSVFVVLAVAGMWSIDYFFSPDSQSAHQIHDAAGG